MLEKLKSKVQIVGIIALAAQLTGCYYDTDHHYHPWWHHHDVVVVHEHGY